LKRLTAKVSIQMTTKTESDAYEELPSPGSPSAPWLRVGVMAAASALAGGLAAVWWYRHTLAKLQTADEAQSGPVAAPENSADEAEF
jgi:hypothetical protein